MIDKADRRKQIGEPDGSAWTYDYNKRGEVIRGEKRDPAGNLLDGHRFTYQYDHIGNRITATTGAPDLVASYATNALNQYTQIATPQTEFVRGTAPGAASVTVRGQAVALGQDGSFNARVTGSGPAAIVATALDGSTSTETRTVALPPPTFVPTYDADGNLLNDGRWTYTWDGENRLIALESTPANPIPERIFKRFTYDYQSRRISEERFIFDPAAATGGAGAYVLEKAIRWVNDGWNQSVELLNDRPIRAYVWGVDLSGTRDGAGGVGGLLSSVDMVDGSGCDYFCDGNGNVLALTDGASGEIIGTYGYGPFGDQVSATGKDALLNRIRFSTKIGDLDSDLIYYGYRYYNRQFGLWLSRDPIGENGGKNLCAFLENSPLSRVDYLGQEGVNPNEIVDQSQGVGSLVIKTYHLTCGCRKGDIKSIVKAFKSDFPWYAVGAKFAYVGGPDATKVTKDNIYGIEIFSYPRVYVKVFIDVENGFQFRTLKGHFEVGEINFLINEQGDGVEFSIASQSRLSNLGEVLKHHFPGSPTGDVIPRPPGVNQWDLQLGGTRGPGYWAQTASWVGMLKKFREKHCNPGESRIEAGDRWID